MDPNRFSTFKALEIPCIDDTSVKIVDSIKASAKEKVGILETHRSWFSQELAYKRKHAKLLWLQNPNDQTAEDFTNVRCDNCRTFK